MTQLGTRIRMVRFLTNRHGEFCSEDPRLIGLYEGKIDHLVAAFSDDGISHVALVNGQLGILLEHELAGPPQCIDQVMWLTVGYPEHEEILVDTYKGDLLRPTYDDVHVVVVFVPEPLCSRALTERIAIDIFRLF